MYANCPVLQEALITYCLLSLPTISFAFNSLEGKGEIFWYFLYYMPISFSIPAYQNESGNNDLKLLLLGYEISCADVTRPSDSSLACLPRLPAQVFLLPRTKGYSHTWVRPQSTLWSSNARPPTQPPPTRPALWGRISQSMPNSKQDYSRRVSREIIYTRVSCAWGKPHRTRQ